MIARLTREEAEVIVDTIGALAGEGAGYVFGDDIDLENPVDRAHAKLFALAGRLEELSGCDEHGCLDLLEGLKAPPEWPDCSDCEGERTEGEICERCGSVADGKGGFYRRDFEEAVQAGVQAALLGAKEQLSQVAKDVDVAKGALRRAYLAINTLGRP